jgi:hypothetical protein
MSDIGGGTPSDQEGGEPPRRHWKAAEPFFDLKFSHWIEILLTVGLVGIGLGQIVIYSRQAAIMDKQVTIADTQNKITIESARAFLVIKDISYVHGEPSAVEGGRDFTLTIRNVGKHVAIVTEMDTEPFYGIVSKVLKETPQYYNSISLVVPPIAPDSDTTVRAHIGGDISITPVQPMEPQAFMIGVNDGSIPIWIYGRVRYETGFPGHSGEVGFCEKFVPSSQRGITPYTFITCEYPKYTYIR